MAKKKNLSKDLNFLLYITFSILILLLSISNLQNIERKKVVKVLGAETNTYFWEHFMAKHPTYIDGWIELERMDKVEEIDPNFLK